MVQSQNAPDPKKVAAANLSMATIFVCPEGHNASMELPASHQARSHILDSLETLGFDLKSTADNDICMDSRNKTPEECIKHAPGIWFTKKGLDKLIEAGVSGQALDALKGRKPAALREARS